MDHVTPNGSEFTMLLALDTSGPLCSAALHDGTRVIVERSDDIGRGHAEHLMGVLGELLGEQNLTWRDIDKIACTTGPGSFTGLRVGLATARGLAMALDCTCVGVSTFEAFQYGWTEPIAVVLDARRGQVWMQIFDSGTSSPLALEIDQVEENIPNHVEQLIGSAAPLLVPLRSSFKVVGDANSPPIAAVAQIAAGREREGHEPKPLYLRQADAKPQNPSMVH